MRAVDTNVLARYYLADDPAQTAAAVALIEAGGLFVPLTVVLELEWVLRGVARVPRDNCVRVLRHLLGLPGVRMEREALVAEAIRHLHAGLDFADALHLCASRACMELVTFDDQRFARRATRLGLAPPVRVPA